MTMAVSSHRNYVSATADDLEKAAGALKIASLKSDDRYLSAAAYGASQALYAIAWHDIKDENDMLTIWSMLMTSGDAAESED